MRRPNDNTALPGREPGLDTKQVATWLGYSPRTIAQWAEYYQLTGGNFGIPSRRHGLRKWSFFESQVQRWIDEGGLSAMAHAKPKKKTGS
jgi:hypothetical protein